MLCTELRVPRIVHNMIAISSCRERILHHENGVFPHELYKCIVRTCSSFFYFRKIFLKAETNNDAPHARRFATYTFSINDPNVAAHSFRYGFNFTQPLVYESSFITSYVIEKSANFVRAVIVCVTIFILCHHPLIDILKILNAGISSFSQAEITRRFLRIFLLIRSEVERGQLGSVRMADVIDVNRMRAYFIKL